MNEKAPCGLDCCEICTNRGWEKWLLLVPAQLCAQSACDSIGSSLGKFNDFS